jgi:hypothetical protein
LLPRSISGESLLGLSLRVSPMPGRSIRREKPRDARGRSPEMICRQLLSPLSPPPPPPSCRVIVRGGLRIEEVARS